MNFPLASLHGAAATAAPVSEAASKAAADNEIIVRMFFAYIARSVPDLTIAKRP